MIQPTHIAEHPKGEAWHNRSAEEVLAQLGSAPTGLSVTERDAARELLTTLEARARRRTVGGDKGYDTDDFVAGVHQCHVTPHVTPNVHAKKSTSAIDGRTTRHAGFVVSQRKRKLIEESYGWGKVVGLLRKLRHRGRETVGWIFAFTNGVYNLVRIRTLIRIGVCA